MIKDIIIHPDRRLRQKSTPVNQTDILSCGDLLNDMIETMQIKEGIGLAAAQIGVAKRIIIVAAEQPLVLINPQIVKHSWRKTTEEEGCLSVPNVTGLVKRYQRIMVRALARQGSEICFWAEGLLARVIQHEIDHLDGVLFIDRAKKLRTAN